VGVPEPVEPCQSPLGVAPKRLYAIDVGTATGKLIVAMIYPVMGVIAHIYQPVIAPPSIGMDEAF
jgi:hypothetical protein